MNTNDISKQLEEKAGGLFATQNQLVQILRLGKPAIRELLSGLDYVQLGRSHRYCVSDVARVLYARRQRAGDRLWASK